MNREDQSPSEGMTLDQFRARLRLLYAREHGSRSKTGNPACTEAASKLAKREAGPEDHKQLAECRAMGKHQAQARRLKAAGQDAKAQHLEHRAKGSGPVSAKSRKAQAEKLKAAHRAKAAPQPTSPADPPRARAEAGIKSTRDGRYYDESGHAPGLYRTRDEAVAAALPGHRAAADREATRAAHVAHESRARAEDAAARKATLEHEAGHEGKAQHLAHRAKGEGPVSAKARQVKAKEMKDAHKAKVATRAQAAPPAPPAPPAPASGRAKSHRERYEQLARIAEKSREHRRKIGARLGSPGDTKDNRSEISLRDQQLKEQYQRVLKQSVEEVAKIVNGEDETPATPTPTPIPAPAPSPEVSASPSRRVITLERTPKSPERRAFDEAFHAMHDANRVLQQTVEAHGPYSDAAKSTAGYYKNKIEAAREAYRALKRSGRAPETGPEAPAAAPAAGKEPPTWGEKIGAPFTPFSNNTPRAPIDHDLVGHHEHYNFGTSNEHVAYTIANRNLRQARRKAEAAAEAFGADSPQARKFAAERDAAQARFDEVSAPGYTAPESEKTADVIARLKGAKDDASSGGPAPVPSPPASPPSDRLADLAGEPGTEPSAKPKATRTPKPPAAPKPPKAVTPEKARAKVIEAMGAPGGMPLSTVELRQKTGLDKPSFDDAVNDLLESGHLNGHRHDFVQSLDDEDRAKLVPARHAGNDPQRTHFAVLSRPKAPPGR